MRKILLVLGIVLTLLIVVAVAAVFLVDVNRYRGVVQAQLERPLGRKVTLGNMSLGLMPLRVRVQNPTIAEDPAFGTERPFVSADALDVRVSLSSLLHGNVDVQAIELQHPQLELVQNKQGVWNFSTIGATTTSPAGPPQEGKQGGALSIDKLTIRDGQVAITDLRSPKNRTVYDHVDLTSQLKTAPGTFASTGNLKLNAARFNGVDIGYPIALDYDVLSNSAEGTLTINNAKLLLGQTPVSIAGTINTNAMPPRLNLSMKTGDVTIGELARMASVFGVAFAPDTTVTGKLNADVKATGTTTTPALNGKIAARDLKISSKQVAQPIEVKAVDLSLSPTEIRSTDFTATTGKTNVSARFAVRQYASPSPSMDLALRSPGATLPEIQSLAHAYGMTGLDQMKGEGKLDLDLRASGTAKSLSAESLMRAVNGAINLDFNALRISGFDTASEVGAIGGFGQKNAAAGAFTDILKLTGHIAVKDGVAQTDDLKAEIATGRLSATGTADLATNLLNLKLAAVLSKESTQKVGGIGVAGYMKTALSNSDGELVIPTLVTGTFAQPKFSPDVQTFVQLQKQRLIPGYQPGQKPAETIKGILGGLFGGKK
jgi:uncharacterized protein involved in outer membrane biogenesis